MPARKRTKIGGLTSGEKRVVYMSQLIDALPNPLPEALLLPVKHMQEMVRHYNGHAAAIQRLNEKIESQRKRLSEFEKRYADDVEQETIQEVDASILRIFERGAALGREMKGQQLPEVSNDNCIG